LSRKSVAIRIRILNRHEFQFHIPVPKWCGSWVRTVQKLDSPRTHFLRPSRNPYHVLVRNVVGASLQSSWGTTVLS